jgi:hypothetical protein
MGVVVGESEGIGVCGFSSTTPKMPLDGGRSDIEGLGNLPNRKPLGSKLTKAIRVETSPWASETGTSAAGGGYTAFHPFDQKRPLELGHRGHDVQQELPRGRRSVEGLGDGDEADPQSGKFVEGRDHVA